MEHLLLAIIIVLLLVIFALLAKVYLLRKAAREIAQAFSDRIDTDTNTLIDISSGDRHMRALAAAINRELRVLRGLRCRYQNGDQELKEAVVNISHDLRTPLTAICGYMDLLARADKTENAARYLALIQNRVDAMKQLTEELFRCSVILSEHEEPEAEIVCMNDVLEESIADFYGLLCERGITPEITMPERRVERMLNKAALMRVFGNILSNAAKYSEGDLRIILWEEGGVTFSNTAPALSEVQVGKLFNRFFTVEAARNSSGLGLSIAKTLVERMGGRIGARYEDGMLHITLDFDPGSVP